MIKASMLEFARTGRLGPLASGVSRHEVHRLLGDPPLWGTQAHMHEEAIWRYGDIEIHFYNDVIEMIFSDHEHLNSGGEWITIEPWVIRKGLSRTEFEQQLITEGLSFESKQWQADRSQTRVLVNRTTMFSFCDRPEDQQDQEGLIWWSSGGRI